MIAGHMGRNLPRALLFNTTSDPWSHVPLVRMVVVVGRGGLGLGSLDGLATPLEVVEEVDGAGVVEEVGDARRVVAAEAVDGARARARGLAPGAVLGPGVGGFGAFRVEEAGLEGSDEGEDVGDELLPITFLRPNPVPSRLFTKT